MTIYETLKAAIEAEQPVSVATIVAGDAGVGAKLLIRPDGTTLGALGGGLDQQEIVRDALAMLARDESGIKAYTTSTGDLSVFFESYAPPPTMYIVGAVHIAIPLVTFAKTLGFRVWGAGVVPAPLCFLPSAILTLSLSLQNSS